MTTGRINQVTRVVFQFKTEKFSEFSALNSKELAGIPEHDSSFFNLQTEPSFGLVF